MFFCEAETKRGKNFPPNGGTVRETSQRQKMSHLKHKCKHLKINQMFFCEEETKRGKNSPLNGGTVRETR
jgi:hypothetical protein